MLRKVFTSPPSDSSCVHPAAHLHVDPHGENKSGPSQSPSGVRDPLLRDHCSPSERPVRYFLWLLCRSAPNVDLWLGVITMIWGTGHLGWVWGPTRWRSHDSRKASGHLLWLGREPSLSEGPDQTQRCICLCSFWDDRDISILWFTGSQRAGSNNQGNEHTSWSHCNHHD